MDNKDLVKALREESLYANKATLEIMDYCMSAADAIEHLKAENATLCARSTCKGCIYFGEFGEDEDVPCNECSRVIRGTDHYRRKPVTADEQEGIT